MTSSLGNLLAKSASLIAGALIVSILMIAGARAEAPFVFNETPGKLPKTVVPIHYALELAPDLDKLKVAGNVAIDIEVRASADRLVLNALGMTFASASVDGAGPASDIAFDADAQTVTLTFAQPLEIGRRVLRIAYTGEINRNGRGIYYSDYQTPDGRKRMLASHSEPADARRIFPGFDEPAFKATFDLTVTVPRRFLAVSNMPVTHEVPIGGRMKRVSFERTPVMSTYLFVVVAGELDRVTVAAEGTTIGIVTTRGKSPTGRYAINETIALLNYFNDYFGVKYPLPKLDLIALPGRSGAMEHWGGITFTERGLLYDAGTNSLATQRRIFSLIAHEVAHQWFGNLVTMAWWNDLWLNESFASWMQYKAAADLHPEWQSWLNSNGAKQSAMSQDAQRTSRPIRKTISNEGEARSAFDTVTYSKGQALVRMAENYLGEGVFRDAIRQYMKTHAYSSATTADLWRALDLASGKPVSGMASTFTDQAGVPLVSAAVRCAGDEQRLILAQDQFTLRAPAAGTLGAKPLRWQVPVTFGPVGEARPADAVLLDGSAEIAAGRCGETIKLNLGDVGYYRVQYDAAMRQALAHSLPAMLPADRVNLLADAWALVESHRSPPAAFFDLTDRLAGDDHRTVADQVIRVLSRIDQAERGRAGQAAFHAYARGILRPIFGRLGWDAPAGEESERAILRARLVRVLGEYGDDAVNMEAKLRFAALANDAGGLRPDLRSSVTELVGRTADRATYDSFLDQARKTQNAEESMLYYSAAASALDPALAKDMLARMLTDELSNDRVSGIILRVATEHPELAWSFVKDNYTALSDKLGASPRGFFLSSLMGNFNDRVHAEEIKAFKPLIDAPGGRAVAERIAERLTANADFVDRQLPAIDDWIAGRQAGP
jgi:aminopeptidase N